MKELPPVAELLQMLAAAPREIAVAVDSPSPAVLRRRPGPDDWSANEVLAHVRSCADVWGDCLVRIASSGEPLTIRAINPRTWMRDTDYLDLEFGVSFDAYTKQRRALVSRAKRLSPEEWSREATITGAGKPLVRSAHTYAEWIARHEQPHIKQIAAAVRQP